MFPQHLFLANTELELKQQTTAHHYELLLASQECVGKRSARKRLLLACGRILIRLGMALQSHAGYEFERPQLAK
jgi:hypothetical protein